MMTTDIPLHRFPYRHKDDLPFAIRWLDPREMWRPPSPDRHTFYALFWIMEGAGFHYIDDVRYDILPQTLYLLRPGQSHFFEVTQPPKGISIFFLEEFFFHHKQSQLIEFFYLTDHLPALQLRDAQAEQIEPIIEQLLYEYRTERIDYSSTLQHLTHLLLIFVRRFYLETNPAWNKPKSTQLFSQFQRLVDTHFKSVHHVQSYSDLLGITSGYLNYQVKTVTGLPASKVIHRRIVVEAKRLLAHTHLTVSELSTDLGFKDSSYFARFFRRETGVAPLAFRRSYHEKYRNGLD